jgi:hypothetical protein
MDFPIILNTNLFPVQAFFNAMPARSLVTTLKAFCSGVGAGFNDAACEFPNELNEGEPKFDGVRFEIFDEAVVISNSEFFGIISDVCAIYIEKYPADKDAIHDLMKLLKDVLNNSSS